jgi:hypothetical protein
MELHRARLLTDAARRGRRENHAYWGVSRLPFLPAGSTVCASGRTLGCSLGSYPQSPPVVTPPRGTTPSLGGVGYRAGAWTVAGPGGRVIAGVRRYHRDAPARSSAGRLPLNRKRAAAPSTLAFGAGWEAREPLPRQTVLLGKRGLAFGLLPCRATRRASTARRSGAAHIAGYGRDADGPRVAIVSGRVLAAQSFDQVSVVRRAACPVGDVVPTPVRAHGDRERSLRCGPKGPRSSSGVVVIFA